MNEDNSIEKRNRSCLDFVKLTNTVRECLSLAVKKGYSPTEVWLGEADARILMVELNWQFALGQLGHTNSNISAVISGNADGMKLMGLRVRAMGTSGVRVGISFSNEEDT